MRQIEFALMDGGSVTGLIHAAADRYSTISVRPAVLICPGGGYHVLATHESEPVMARFFAAGYQVFSLNYSVTEENPETEKKLGKTPLKQAAQAMAELRNRVKEFCIAEDQIAILGFSAGGHLAGSLAVHWQAFGEASKPNAAVLCYPVTSCRAHPASISFRRLCRSEEECGYFCLEEQVTAAVPPVFLWHTVTDASVPVEGSLSFVSALNRAGVSWEGHFYGSGSHGLSLATEAASRPYPTCAAWSGRALDWLKEQGFALEGADLFFSNPK